MAEEAVVEEDPSGRDKWKALDNIFQRVWEVRHSFFY
jgi:hypothetical protein